MKLFLRTVGYTRMDKKRNVNIYGELNAVALLDYIESYSFNWKNHLHCMKRNNISRQVQKKFRRNKKEFGYTNRIRNETLSCI